MKNHFTIYSNWAPRAASPAEIGTRALQSLDALSAICPLFHPWWLVDLSLTIEQLAEMNNEERHHESVFSLEEVRSRIVEIIELGVWRDDYNEPMPRYGYSFCANNTMMTSPQSVGLSVDDGGLNEYGSHNFDFRTPFDRIPDPAIVAYPVFKAVLTTLARIWRVDEARAYSSDLQECWNRPIERYDLSWTTYLSAPLARQITPPSDVLVERMDDGGILLIAAEETFDVNNPQHMAAARSIRDALGPLNAAAKHGQRN